MGSTLTNTQPKDTYKSLLKTSDSSELSATAKLISDGNGNDSVLTLSTNSVGIGTGTMPSTNTYAHFHPGPSNTFLEGGGDLNLANNGYYSSGWKRKLANAASMVYQFGGQIDFLRAATGTAGSAISWSTIASITANGLTFNGDTAAANALDDYEEGTWTPIMAGATFTLTTALGYYTKIGRQVSIWVECEGTYSSPTGVFKVTSLPFTQAGGRAEGIFSAISGISFGGYCSAEIISTEMFLESHASGTGTNRTDMGSTFFNASGFRFMVSATYFV